MWYNGVIVLYFAFGSNCNLSALHRYLVQHGCDPKGIRNPRRAILRNYRIASNYQMTDLWGAANIEPATGKHVEGVVMGISPDVHHLLHRKEGWPRRYRETTVCVHLPRMRQNLIARTYIVTDECRLTTDMPVHPDYRATILEAAQQWGFSRDYQKRLRKLLCTTADCTERNEPRHVQSCR